MRDKTKAIKALGLFIAFLVVVPVISIFIEFGSYVFEAFASSDESRLAQISGNLSHFLEFLFFILSIGADTGGYSIIPIFSFFSLIFRY